MIYLNTFASNLLPVLLLCAAGFILRKTLAVEPRPLSQVIFYILSPALIFNLLTKNELPTGRIAGMMVYATIVMLLTAALAYLGGRLLHLERLTLASVVLTAMIANNGNYGLPLIAFAFGEEAEAYASVYFVTSSIMGYTLGVLIASLGRLHIKQALLGLLKVPAVYAILLAVFIIHTGWVLPVSLDRSISLAAAGSIPAMLVLLGLELGQFIWNRNLKTISLPVVIRLVIAPLIGLGLAVLFGLQGTTRQAGITETGMPSAVMTTMLAAEYKLETNLTTAIVFTSTILSPFTLTILLVFLGK